MSLHEPVYSDGQDALFVMDQVSDKKNKEENWIEELSLEAAMERLNEKSDILSHFVFLKERRRWKLQSRSIFRSSGKPSGEECFKNNAQVSFRKIRVRKNNTSGERTDCLKVSCQIK